MGGVVKVADFTHTQGSCFGTFFSRINHKIGLPDLVAKKMAPYVKANYTLDTSYGWDLIACKRNNFIDELVLKEIQKGGIKSIFNIGCGLCTRFWRLGLDQTNIEWVDCDYSKIIEAKFCILRGSEIETPDNYKGISCDLSNTVIPTGFDLYIAEGFFMWLDKEYIKNNIPGKIIFDAVGMYRVTGLRQEHEWLFDEKEDTWNNVNFESIQTIDPETRDHRVILATPK